MTLIQSGVKLEYSKGDAGIIRNRRPFLNPRMMALGDGRDGINPATFIERVRNKFFPLTADLERVDMEFLSAMNRGAKTLNFLMGEYLPDRLSDLKVGHFSEETKLEDLIREARRRYRSLAGTGSAENKRSIYELIRAIELGHQILKVDTEKEVQLSLRHYQSLVEWFNKFLGITSGVPCDRLPFRNIFNTTIDVDLYGEDDQAFHSRLKCLTSDGRIKYGSIIMKTYLDLLDEGSKPRYSATKDYTGVEFLVSNEKEANDLAEAFRYTNPMRLLEGFKQRKRASEIKDNPEASPAFGLTKFILRIPVKVEPIKGHPLGDLLCQLLPVEVQILTLEDQHIRASNPDAKHESYKKRQFERVVPGLFPREIYRKELYS